MKKKILFILNTYNFQSNFLKKNLSLNQNYLRFNKEDQNWFNYFYNNLKKDFFLKKDYPNLNKTILGENYCEFLQKKINRFKPHLIFSNVNDKNIENLLSKYNNTKKIIWVSHLISKKKLKYYKNIFEYLITDNDHIYKQAKYLKFKVFNFRISAPAYIKLNKKDFIKRRSEIYFSGSLGYNFQYRFDILNFLNNNFKIKIRVRNLVEKYKILNFVNSFLLKIFPTFTQKLYKKKILPFTNNLKYINQDELFGKEMLNELKKFKICINIHSDFGKNKTINMRVYEALSAGCLLISDKNEKMEKFFKNKNHVIYFNNKNDLNRKIDYYLKNSNEAFKIANNGNILFRQKFQSAKRLTKFKRLLNNIIIK